MTHIKKITDKQGNNIYLRTHTKAVVDDNGYTAESRLQAMQDEINQKQLEVGAVPSDLTPTEDSTNWVTSGGVYSAINEIRNDIKTIISSLGNYAFINGKPSFPWMSDLRIINNFSNVISSNYREYINTGESYNTTLKGSGMYAVDDSSVVVTMGGTDITSSTYSTSTHTISISNVTGNITITASGITYVENGLVFHLDGINKGTNEGKWTDLAGGVQWTNYNATPLANGWEFSNGAYMLDDGTLPAYNFYDVTYEMCINSNTSNKNYFIFVGTDASICASFIQKYYSHSWFTIKGLTEKPNRGTLVSNLINGTGNFIISISGETDGSGVWNGSIQSFDNLAYSASGTAVIGKRIPTTSSGEEFPFTGTIHSIRIYNRILSTNEMLQNQKIDNIRFEMGLNI